MAAISLILLTPSKVWVSSFLSVNRNRISVLVIMKNLKNGCHFFNINHMEKFEITDPPQSLGLWLSYQKTGDANFLFCEFSIGSFFIITHPRFHFNIYAWIHLKHLCVDIYASLVYPSRHLCVVLHFLIFFVVHLFSSETAVLSAQYVYKWRINFESNKTSCCGSPG